MIENTSLIRQNNQLIFKKDYIECNEFDIHIKVNFAGICGTDLDIIRNARADRAGVLGHEGIGTIVDVGRNVKNFNIGERLVFNPVNSVQQDDILGHSRMGIFQTYFKYNIQDLHQSLLHKIDNTVEDELGALIEPLGTALYGKSLIDQVCNPKSVVIIGSGPIGLINAILFKSFGLKVFMINKSFPRLKFGIDQGILAKEDVFLDDDNLVEAIKTVTHGGADLTLLCTNRSGALKSLKKALEYTKDSGCINLVGGIQNGDFLKDIIYKDLNHIRRNNVCGVNSIGYTPLVDIKNAKKIYFTGHRGTSCNHLNLAINLLKSDKDSYNKVVTHQINFNNADVLLRNAAYHKEMAYLKGAIKFN